MELPNGESSPMQVISEAVVETVTAEGHTTLTTTEESDAESINNYGNRSTVEGQLLGGNISNEVLEPSLGGKRTQKDLVRLEEQNRPGTATIPIREAIASADISAHNYRGGDQPYREVVNQPPKSPSPSIQLHQELLAFSRLADYELGLNRSEAVEVQATQGVGHERELSDDGTQEATDFDSSLIAESHDLEYIQASAEEDVTSDAVVETDLPGPDMNAEGFRSRMSYYSPLATLCQTFGAQIDAMVVVLDTKEIENTSTTTCPYQLSLEVTEPSMSGTAVPVEIVRAPDREALPSVRRGDVVLLRDFTVRTMDHKLMLMSSDISAWAVFDQPDGNIEDVQVNGRPVEFGLEEFDHAKRLREWFTEKGLALAIRQAARRRALEQLSDPAEEASYSSSISSSDTIRRHNASGAATPRNWAKIPKKKNRSLTEKNRRITIHKMRYGRQYTEVGSPPAKEILHELRDGTTWSDI
ncbi:hypothetical protein KEM54_001068 [Ascosphaera aggregata]|nr:hypothetical protein KEM54_001068 [Ascosphaera aggregata]